MDDYTVAERIITAMEDLQNEGLLSTVRAIMRRTGIGSSETVYRHLKVLVDKGTVVRLASEEGRGFYMLPDTKCPLCGHDPEMEG